MLDGEKVMIHADKTGTRSGSRQWIYAGEVFRALFYLTMNGKLGEKYNIVGEDEVTNLQLAEIIARVARKPLDYELVGFDPERPGHDVRYGLDGTKLKAMGFVFETPFNVSFIHVVKWYINNKEWLGCKK